MQLVVFTVVYALTRGTIGRADWECYFHHALVAERDPACALSRCLQGTRPGFQFHALFMLDGDVAPDALAGRLFFHSHHRLLEDTP